jgi:hypothetical protein
MERLKKRQTYRALSEFFAKDNEPLFVRSAEENATTHGQIHSTRGTISTRGQMATWQWQCTTTMKCVYLYNIIGDLLPLSGLSNLKDGETIVDADIVFWIMVGKLHNPKGTFLFVSCFHSSSHCATIMLARYRPLVTHPDLDFTNLYPKEYCPTVQRLRTWSTDISVWRQMDQHPALNDGDFAAGLWLVSIAQ